MKYVYLSTSIPIIQFGSIIDCDLTGKMVSRGSYHKLSQNNLNSGFWITIWFI